ncbi:MAG TPA: phosphate ABC transporter permease PstA [Nitrososphaerales archaeon]|nr:phosphate ABC transporter permease PstA [Nitrososphaerales archaeon]
MKSEKGLSARKAIDKSVRGLTLLVTLLILAPLFDMIYIIVVNAVPSLSLNMFIHTTVTDGILNAIVGSLFLVLLSSVLAVSLGVFSGVYLAEFGGRSASFIRFFADVLTGVPSIVVGYFGYIVFVLYLGWGYSAMAAAIALTIIMIPYVTRTTEFALRKVPSEIKEGSYALGASKATTVNRISFRYAAPGIITGILIAVSISLGETAPLIYTAYFYNYLPNLALFHSPVGYLTWVIWAFINEPLTLAHQQAFVSSFVLMIFVLSLGLGARFLVSRWWKS